MCCSPSPLPPEPFAAADDSKGEGEGLRALELRFPQHLTFCPLKEQQLKRPLKQGSPGNSGQKCRWIVFLWHLRSASSGLWGRLSPAREPPLQKALPPLTTHSAAEVLWQVRGGGGKAAARHSGPKAEGGLQLSVLTARAPPP